MDTDFRLFMRRHQFVYMMLKLSDLLCLLNRNNSTIEGCTNNNGNLILGLKDLQKYYICNNLCLF